jgi:malate synthase
VLAQVRQNLTGTIDAQFLDPACELFEQVALAEQFVDFLTLPAYERID